jgi:hypothetical protein
LEEVKETSQKRIAIIATKLQKIGEKRRYRSPTYSTNKNSHKDLQEPRRLREKVRKGGREEERYGGWEKGREGRRKEGRIKEGRKDGTVPCFVINVLLPPPHIRD